MLIVLAMKAIQSLAIALFFTFAAATSSAFAHNENSVFDEQLDKFTPLELLVDLYNTSNILALGEVNHENFKSSEYLRDLIEKVGMDPHLRFIVVENSFEFAPIFLESSLHPITKKSVEKYGVKEVLPYLVQNPILIEEIFPLLQRINQLRPADRPLLLIPIDQTGVRRVTKDQERIFGTDYDGSWDRENGTKLNFRAQVLSKMDLAQGDKAIVFYHLAHLERAVTGLLFKIVPEEKRFAKVTESPSNWFGMLLADLPELAARSKIVALDEKDTKWAPNGNFLFSQRQSQRHPGRTFAVMMEPLGDLIQEKGVACWDPSRTRNKDQGLRSDAKLSQMIDAIIWTHDANHNLVKNSQSFMRLYELLK